MESQRARKRQRNGTKRTIGRQRQRGAENKKTEDTTLGMYSKAGVRRSSENMTRRAVMRLLPCTDARWPRRRRSGHGVSTDGIGPCALSNLRCTP